jgi:hypothetical protein
MISGVRRLGQCHLGKICEISRYAISNRTLPEISQRMYQGGIFHPQSLHRPRRARKERMGILSYHLRIFPHPGHRLRLGLLRGTLLAARSTIAAKNDPRQAPKVAKIIASAPVTGSSWNKLLLAFADFCPDARCGVPDLAFFTLAHRHCVCFAAIASVDF